MSNKFLVKIYVPTIEKNYEVWLPPNKNIDNVINLLIRAINEQSKGRYTPDKLPNLYNKKTAEMYKANIKIIESDIRNGSELILI